MAEFCNNCLIDIEVSGLKKWIQAGKGDQDMYPGLAGAQPVTANQMLALYLDPKWRAGFQGECAGRVTEEDVKNDKYGVVLCERCDFTLVDHNGNCLTDCDYDHGTIKVAGRPNREDVGDRVKNLKDPKCTTCSCDPCLCGLTTW